MENGRGARRKAVPSGDFHRVRESTTVCARSSILYEKALSPPFFFYDPVSNRENYALIIGRYKI